MGFLFRIYRVLNFLSIDVVLGAVVCALFFANILDVKIRPYGIATLALTVWIIYTIDHLLDAKKLSSNAEAGRHFFHRRHFKQLLVLVIVAIITNSVLLFFIRTQVFYAGFIVTLFVVSYLLVQKRLYYLKEVMVATIYTAGVLIPSLSVTQKDIGVSFIVIFVQFFIVALLNLLIFSLFDENLDQRENFGSFVTKFGIATTKKTIVALLILQALLFAVMVLVSESLSVFLPLLLMTVLTWMIYFFRDTLRKNDVFRLVGDAVFFIPIFFLL